MATRPPYFSLVLIAALSAGAFARPAWAGGLSDLEAFTQSSQQVEKIFKDKAVQGRRKALQNYLTPSEKVSRQFDIAFENLRALRNAMGGIDERMLMARKPMAFLYSSASKPTYRFERVTRPFHSLWLLGSLHENVTDACNPKDTLLLDRWTPMLADANLFAVEKDGKYTGITLTLVPVQAARAAYLLVVPNDSKAVLPPALFAAFLRDYKKREPRTLPLAILTKLGPTNYVIDRVDAHGRKAGRLGPIEGFRLADPMAKKIVASVPAWCTSPGQTAMNSASTAIEPGGRTPASVASGSSGAIAPVIIGGPSAEANVTVNNPAGGTKAQTQSGAGAPREMQQGGRLGPGPQGLRRDGTTIINNVTVPPTFPSRSFATSNSNSDNSVTVPVTQERNPYTPKFDSGAGQGSGASPMAKSAPNSPSGSSGSGSNSSPRGGGALGGGADPRGSVSGIDPSKLSPSDKQIFDAIQKNRDALNSGKPIPPQVTDVIARGAMGDALDPKIKRAAEENLAETYFNNETALQAYDAIQKRQEKRPDQVRTMLQKLDRDLCTHCPDCAACRGIQGKEGGASK